MIKIIYIYIKLIINYEEYQLGTVKLVVFFNKRQKIIIKS